MATSIALRNIDRGVAFVVVDAADRSVNTLTAELGGELTELIGALEADDACCGAVIASGKRDSFVVGADIDRLSRLQSRQQAEEISRRAQQLLDRLAEATKPVVAAIHGPCLGGGLELALACHGRVCSDAPATALGLPEVKLGLIPGAGGTQRLPRLIGVQAALDLILTGSSVRPVAARKLGLVDEVVELANLENAAAARARLLAASHGPRDWHALLDRELANLRRWTRSAKYAELLLGGNPLGRRVLLNRGAAAVRQRSGDRYPAPYAALRAVEAGLARGLEHGLQVESEQFAELLVSPVSRRLVELFQATQALKKETGSHDPKLRARPVERLAVLGGGLMGAGIAGVAAGRGISVRIKERDAEQCGLAVQRVWSTLRRRIKRGQLDARGAAQIAARVSASGDLAGLARCDLVIEAVFEELALKSALLAQAEERVGESCVLASNTSSLPIAKLAAACRRPHNVLGMHFFSPVPKMPLLEVIRQPQTCDQALVTAVALGKRLGKHTIVVRDGVGFYTSRILAPYISEATHVLAEGAPIDAVDEALCDFGFPVGPITLLDEVGIDVAEKVSHVMMGAYGERLRHAPLLPALVADNRQGHKNRRGFYLYDGKKGDRRVDVTVYDLLPGGRRRARVNPAEVQRRLVLQMVNEAMHCLGEGILQCPRDGDIGAIYGLAFPPFLGGPFRYTDGMGAGRLVDELLRLRDRFGLRFEPAPALVEAARGGRSFYPA
ncbi:MAG: enoyl-CoA hydratase/isomerase family protein [Deltaproteobacteria bacterium]|nr:enoyl-CoA hydratase/isomerase family protein [Deltaproteobacteria bacterium]